MNGIGGNMFNKMIMSFLFIFGVALAGSEGDWMPWPNITGLLMFALLGYLANREKEIEE